MNEQPKLPPGWEDDEPVVVVHRRDEPKPDPKNVNDLMELRLKDRVVKLSPVTVGHYRRCLRFYGEYLGRVPQLSDLAIDPMMDWLEHMVEKEGIRATTANARAKQVKAIWNWAANRRYIDQGPPERFKIPEERPIPDAWTGEELKRLFVAAAGMDGTIGPHWANDYYMALLWFVFNTGERAGAVLRVTPEMIDLDAGTVEVPASIRKAENLRMKWWLTPKCVEAVARIMPQVRGAVFDGGWAGRHGYHCSYRKLLRIAGIQPTRRNGLHKLRRTVGSWIKLRGGDPSVWLGHAPKNVADGHYVDRWMVQTQRRDIWPINSFNPDTEGGAA